MHQDMQGEHGNRAAAPLHGTCLMQGAPVQLRTARHAPHVTVRSLKHMCAAPGADARIMHVPPCAHYSIPKLCT
jgi:hypothetical protein